MVKGLSRQRDEIDEMQCDHVRSWHQICIFTVCHLQKKHMTANKPLYMTSIDLEVPRDVI